MLRIEDLIADVAKMRLVFHSEADFQHSFAWELHLHYPTARLRLERAFASPLGRLHIDIDCSMQGQSYVFELKYKTRAADLEIDGEEFHLQDHSGQPPGRYDFLKDIVRLEAIVHSSSQSIQGFAILLTNDSAYWSIPRSTDGVSNAFSLQDGRVISGELDWGPTASAGTRKNRERPIMLRAEYKLQWRDYVSINVRGYSHFRYLAVPIIPICK